MKRIFFIHVGVVVIALCAVISHSQPASAVTPPDSCFALSGGTITQYYAFENNNPINPACPTAVDIPATIGGTPITAITGPSPFTGAFQSRNLTSVTMPNTVTTIGDHAFRENIISSLTLSTGLTTIGNTAFYINRLTQLTVPDSVISIGASAFNRNKIANLQLGNSLTTILTDAFMQNSIVEVTVPTSLTSIGISAFAMQNPKGLDIQDDIYSGNPTLIQQAYNSTWFMRLYTADPLNLAGFTDDCYFEAAYAGGDLNSNGTQDDVLGGHVVNPAYAVIRAVDGAGTSLQPDVTYTGNQLTSYTNADNQPSDSSPSAVQAMFDRYFRIGDTVTLTAPTIAGYVPTPAQLTAVLGASTVLNTKSFVYAATTSGTPTLAETGVSWTTIVTSILLLMAIGLMTLPLYRFASR